MRTSVSHNHRTLLSKAMPYKTLARCCLESFLTRRKYTRCERGKHMRKNAALTVVCALALLCGCSATENVPKDNISSPSVEQSISAQSSHGADSVSGESAESGNPLPALPTVSVYIQQVVREHTAKFEKPGITEYEKVKAAFDYVMELGYFIDPPALDVWRWRTVGDSVPTREEMRGLNMLLFGAETCEGYAAALNMLLEEMDIETRYMTGLTYLARGGLGYHSWCQVKIDGVWYHIDPELEDAVSKDGTVVYKYFLKSDASMRRSHYWGQRLINMGRLAAEQEAEIAAYYLGENCPRDYPAPAKRTITVNEEPDVEAIRAELCAELAEYERLRGTLEYMDLGTEPPVFVNYYLDKRGVSGVDQDMVTFAEIYQPTHCIIRKPGTENADLSMLPEEKQFGYILY